MGKCLCSSGLQSTLIDAHLAGAKTLVNPSARLTKWRKRPSAWMNHWISAHYVLGFIYHFSGRYDEAIAEGERAVELNPNGADALAFLGNILNRAGRPEEAIPALAQGNAAESHASGLLLRVLGGKLHAHGTV